MRVSYADRKRVQDVCKDIRQKTVVTRGIRVMRENENRTNTDSLTRECLECGQEFIPDKSGQECCANVCASAWYGWNEFDDQERITVEDDDYPYVWED